MIRNFLIKTLALIIMAITFLAGGWLFQLILDIDSYRQAVIVFLAIWNIVGTIYYIVTIDLRIFYYH